MSDHTQQTADASNNAAVDTSINNQSDAAQTTPQTGVDQVPNSAQAEPVLSPRQRQMQEIIANRQAVQNEELIYGEQLGDAARQASGQAAASAGADANAVVPKPVANSEPNTNSDNSAQQAAQTGVDNVASPASAVPDEAVGADGRIAVTVSGQQFRLTRDELNALVIDGANARLAATGAAVQQQRQAPVTQPTQPAQSQNAVAQPAQQPRDFSQLLSDAEAQELYSSIAIGNEADGAAAIRRLGGMIASRIAASEPRPVPVDTNAIALEAAQRAQAEIIRQNNLQTIASEFPDIFSDARIGRMAGEEVQNLAAQYRALGINKSQLDLFREGCQNIRGLFGTRASDQTGVIETTANASPQPTVTVQPRETGKGGLQTVPQGAGSRTSQVTQAVQPTKKPSDVVNSMRKSRGQAVYR